MAATFAWDRDTGTQTGSPTKGTTRTGGVTVNNWKNTDTEGTPACTGDGDRLLYTTPSTTTNANLTTDMTAAIAIGSGVAVFFSATGPEATGKASSSSTVPAYTNFLTTQLQ